MPLFEDYGGFEYDESMEPSFNAASYSPAVATMYEAPMTRTDSNSTNVGTVSPQDLMVRDLSFSAPASTAFTNLTSPSIYDQSPDFTDSYDVSPMFQNADADIAPGEWYSLFPDANADNTVTQDNSSQSPLDQEEELVVSEHLRKHSRRQSGTSPGINKRPGSSKGLPARKRNSDLPPIVVEDPEDSIAVKRARNTLAARKSRQKKMERFDELEGEIDRLKDEVAHWKAKALGRSAAME